MSDNGDFNKVLDFISDFQAAGRQVTDRIEESFSKLWPKIDPAGYVIDKLGDQLFLHALACDRVLNDVATHISAYSRSAVQRDLFEKHGPDGRAALFNLLENNEFDSIVTAKSRSSRNARLNAEIRLLVGKEKGPVPKTIRNEYEEIRADIVLLARALIGKQKASAPIPR